MSTTKPTSNQTKKSRFRRISDWLHLWLGLFSGLIVFIVATTGCIFAFQVEITAWIHHDEIFVNPPAKAQPLPLSQLQKEAEKALGNGIKVGFVETYQSPERAWIFGSYKAGNPNAFFYFDAIDYYKVVYVNPYTGKVNLVKDYKYDFFNVVKFIHWSLLINHPIGQQLVGWSTFIFVILLITGMIHWWPKNLKKSNFDKSFKVKWKAKFKRLNYDLHNVPGFYALLVCLILALTGLVWAFQWFQATVYAVASQSTTPPIVKTFKSDSTGAKVSHPLDISFEQARQMLKGVDRIGMNPPTDKSGTISAYGYRGLETYYDFDVLQFDQYTGKFINRRNHSEQNTGEKLIGMNYDIHVGAVLGLTGKIMAFFASLVAATLPITGFIIWLGKKKKKKKKINKARCDLTEQKQ
ncbi:PepSY-associated TM helix domain-containing protein [Pedobacter sp. ASV12]|uniref:PepSY-associated TM helix domain-containing protein n=1 Tax=Pedobacter sp. ASV12 TaxID=2795120 RepID=UPI0018EA7C87|nr:PepSY-associated TM helix domain-containing protein [Pedobacter sp. ASV12]